MKLQDDCPHQEQKAREWYHKALDKYLDEQFGSPYIYGSPICLTCSEEGLTRSAYCLEINGYKITQKHNEDPDL